MPGQVGWGAVQGSGGREAARQAAQMALNGLAGTLPQAGFVFAAQEYPLAEVYAGLGAVVGDLPIFGLSTSQPFSHRGEHAHHVLVALLGGTGWKIDSILQPPYHGPGAAIGRGLMQALTSAGQNWQGLLLAGSGRQAEIAQVIPYLTGLDLPVGGALSAGEQQNAFSLSTPGNSISAQSLTALGLGGSLRLGTGLGQGWQDSGLYWTVTKANGVLLQELDGLPPAAAYARIFGNSAHQWSLPPLNRLVRQYPLGIEVSAGQSERTIRSPLVVENNGTFRMNAVVAPGEVVHLMIGSVPACLASMRAAARQAIRCVTPAQPRLAVVLVDAAWQMLLVTHPGQWSSVWKEELGDLPMIGAYTTGQITRPPGDALVRFYNQAILVSILAEE